jgi:hypothetical protein
MKFSHLEARVAAMEADQEDPDETENDKILMQIWPEHFEKHLAELGLSDLIDEFRAEFLTIGPRPFGHNRRDDRPVWACIEDVSNNHHEHTYRIRAADSLAWADVRTVLGDSEEEVLHWKEYAASDLEREKEELQITCDLCNADLSEWHCYSFMADKMVKICRTCSTTRILTR